MDAGQKKWDQSRERMGSRVNDTIQELLSKKQQLEARQATLLEEFHNRPKFGVRRLGRAFPAIKKGLLEHLNHMDRK